MKAQGIRLFVSDVDGTLLDGHKQLTEATRTAVTKLQAAGIPLALVSARPPRGLRWLSETLNLQGACAALNAAIILDAQFEVKQQRQLDSNTVHEILALLLKHDLGAWVYTSEDWFVSRLDAAHVRHEIEAVEFSPLLFTALDEIQDPIVKIVGVGDDPKSMNACEQQMQQRFGKALCMTHSLENRLEITDREANKGTAVKALGTIMGVPPNAIATAGDGENDIAMFHQSGFSIAMAQAPIEVRRAASQTTSSNANDGLAWAIETFILPRNE